MSSEPLLLPLPAYRRLATEEEEAAYLRKVEEAKARLRPQRQSEDKSSEPTLRLVK